MKRGASSRGKTRWRRRADVNWLESEDGNGWQRIPSVPGNFGVSGAASIAMKSIASSESTGKRTPAS